MRRRAAVLLLAAAFPAVAGLAPAQAGDSLSAQMHRLRNCESGNNYRLADHNTYFGAYQFAQGTWNSLGFSGRPDHASPATQDKAAAKLHAAQGWRPWPYCSKHEHLH